MFARALVVLLLMLNLGIGLWWLARPAAITTPPAALPTGVARLQLVQEVPGRVSPAAMASAAAPVSADTEGGQPRTVADAMRCFSFGPFADAQGAARARDRLSALPAAGIRLREVVSGPRGWSVAMPPLGDRAAADAMATRIRAAGFDDLFVVPTGEGANSIALGRYGNEAAARQRVTTLQAAGFPAQARPIGEAGIAYWIDVAAGPDVDLATARDASGAAQANLVDCPPEA
ncbi:SPOR domain-containing protein [soil metagenome]